MHDADVVSPEEATMTTNEIHEVFPYVRVTDTRKAVAFYERAFGAEFLYQLVEPSGRVGHAEVKLGPVVLMISDEFPEFGLEAPPTSGAVGFSIHLHVDDCDRSVARAVEAGAVVVMPPTDQFYGERSSRIRDPFGHHWLIGSSIEKLTPDEMQRRYTAMLTT